MRAYRPTQPVTPPNRLEQIRQNIAAKVRELDRLYDDERNELHWKNCMEPKLAAEAVSHPVKKQVRPDRRAMGIAGATAKWNDGGSGVAKANE